MNSRKFATAGRRAATADQTTTEESFAVYAKDYQQVSFLLDDNSSFDLAMRGPSGSAAWDTPRVPPKLRSESPEPVKLNFTPMKKFNTRLSRVSVGPAPPEFLQENRETENSDDEPASPKFKAPFVEISNSLKQSFGWSGKPPPKRDAPETTKEELPIPIPTASNPVVAAEVIIASNEIEPTENITTRLSSINLSEQDQPEPQVLVKSLAKSNLEKKPATTIKFPKATLPTEFNFSKPENRVPFPTQKQAPTQPGATTFTRLTRQSRGPPAPIANASSAGSMVDSAAVESLGEAVITKLRVASPTLDVLKGIAELPEPTSTKKVEAASRSTVPKVNRSKPIELSASHKVVTKVQPTVAPVASSTATPPPRPPSPAVIPSASVESQETQQEDMETIVIQPSVRVAANIEPSLNAGAARIFKIVAQSPVKESRQLELPEPEAVTNSSTKKRALDADLPLAEKKEQSRAPSRAAPAKRARVDTGVTTSSATASSQAKKNAQRLGKGRPRLSNSRVVSAPARMTTTISTTRVRAAITQRPQPVAKPEVSSQHASSVEKEKPKAASVPPPFQSTVPKAFTFTSTLRLEARKPAVPTQPRKPITFEPKVVPDFALLHASLPPNAQYKPLPKPQPKTSTLPSGSSDGPLNLKLGFRPTVPHTPKLCTISRARERAEFEKHLKEKEEAREKELEKERLERIRREEEEERVLRKYIDAVARENVHEVPKFYKDRKGKGKDGTTEGEPDEANSG